MDRHDCIAIPEKAIQPGRKFDKKIALFLKIQTIMTFLGRICRQGMGSKE
jgi:hypothetical protein